MSVPSHRAWPKRRRFLSLVLVAALIWAVGYRVLDYVYPPAPAYRPAPLENLRIIDPALDQYGIETTRPGSTPAPKAP